MESVIRETLAGRMAPRACAVLMCVAHACYMAGFYRSPLGLLGERAGLEDAGLMYMGQILFLLSTGVACLVVRGLEQRGLRLVESRAAVACLVASLLCCVLEAYALPDATRFMLLPLRGVLGAIPLLLCFDGFLTIYRMLGKTWCVASIGASTAVMGVFELLGHMLFGEVAGTVPALAVLMCAAGLAFVAFYRQDAVRRTIVDGAGLPAGASAAGAVGVRGALAGVPMPGDARVAAAGGEVHAVACDSGSLYRLSLYVGATVASFGVTYGLSNGVLLTGGPWGLAMGASDVAGIVACVLLVLCALWRRPTGGIHFGGLIRVTLASAGFVFGLAPVLAAHAPNVLPPLLRALAALQGCAMILISVEISYERRLPMSEVMPVNYIVFVLCLCGALGVLWALEDTGSSHGVWDAVAALGVVATVAVIPALPSNKSTAATFALSRLPENETYEDRTARRVHDVVRKYGLSHRESEVFVLLIKGMTRGEIAQELSLSSWTVKEYIAGVYGKVGVHSAKELMILIAGDE